MKYPASALLSLVFATLLAAFPAAADEFRAPGVSQQDPLTISVYRSPTCGCCKDWVTHLRQHGFTVVDHVTADMTPVKERLGVPGAARSCHTATIGGYFIEGHVPADDIKRILAQQPQIRGLAVPGMVVGSPGMEVGDRKDPYTVVSVERDGELRAFREYRNY